MILEKRFFSSDCCCKSSIDITIQFLIKKSLDIETVNKIKNTTDILIELNNNNLNAVVYVHPSILFSYVAKKFKNLKIYNVIRNIETAKNLVHNIGIKEYALIHHVTAVDYYLIAENWTHYVCELFSQNKYMLYDSYADYLHKNENLTLNAKNEDIFNISMVTVIVWRK
jgi:hypothetical protein